MLFSSQATRYTIGVLGDSRQIQEVVDKLTDFIIRRNISRFYVIIRVLVSLKILLN